VIADAHIHLFRAGFAARYAPAFARRDEPELYAAMRREHGIDRALVVGFEGMPEHRGNNRDLARWRRTRRWMAPLAFHRAARPPAPSTLERARRQDFVGIALYAAPDDGPRLAAWPEATVRQLNELRSIVSINARPPALARLAPFLARLGGCRVLISHLGLPGAQRVAPSAREARRLTSAIRELAALPQVGVKVSALYALSDPPHDYPHRAAHPLVAAVAEAYGPRRLYWGSDFSPALAHQSFAQAVDSLGHLGWPARMRAAVMGGNLRAALAAAEGRA
jgi:predicted TIM-barrel fold metal-dependent hydrolase